MTHQKCSIPSAPIASRCRKRMILLLAALLAVAMSAAPQAVAQNKKKETFGDWEINCGKPPGARERKCALVQSVIDEERANVGLKVVFLLASGGRKVMRHVDVTVLGKLIDPDDGSMLWIGEASDHHNDEFSHGMLTRVEEGTFLFTKPELPTSGVTRYVEPVLVSGIIVGLIYLFFSNQSDN